MFITFLFTCPVEELGGESGIGLNLENLGYKLGSDTAELVEVFDEGWAPTIVFAEGVDDVTGDWREGLSY